MVGKYFFEFFVVEATLTFDLYVTFLNVALETINVAVFLYDCHSFTIQIAVINLTEKLFA